MTSNRSFAGCTMAATIFAHRIVLWIFTILLAGRACVVLIVRRALIHNVDSENEKTNPKT